MSTDEETPTETLELPGKEECPGQLTWSAFGAWYPDSVCASVLDWTEVVDGYPGDYLCDADDDFRNREVPCPFHDWEGFLDYQWGADEVLVLWASDESPVAAGTEIHFHDAQALWWTATHPERGEERVLMRELALEG